MFNLLRDIVREKDKEFLDFCESQRLITNERVTPAVGERSYVEQQAEELDVQLPKEISR